MREIMAFSLESTKNTATINGLKMLVYGAAGTGKTTLCGTSDNKKTIILSAEGGMLSLAGKDIAMSEIRSMEDLREAFVFLNSKEGQQYEWICLDSISEMAEVCLSIEKGKESDPRRAYMTTQDTITSLVRGFRDLPGRNVVITAKLDRSHDQESGVMLYTPGCPGNKLAQQLPYLFDIVLALRTLTDDEGIVRRFVQTQTDKQWSAKDRSGKLDMFESPDLTELYQKIAA